MIMPDISRSAGLCSTCINNPTCFYLAHRGPTQLCELFDNGVVPLVDRRGIWTRREMSPPPVVNHSDEGVTKHDGLCINCEHRRACSHPRPAGGVWHCEDYE